MITHVIVSHKFCSVFKKAEWVNEIYKIYAYNVLDFLIKKIKEEIINK